jgi:hypothetical protein
MAPRQEKRLSLVTVGYQTFVLPQAQALRFYELASQALEVDYDGAGEAFRSRYRAKGQPSVELQALAPGQLIMPEASVVPASTPRLLGRERNGHA